MPACFIVFGAVLRPDGSPGPALLRRIEGALAAAKGDPDAVFLVTGGQPRSDVTEAAVMARLLREAGIAADRILIEDAAVNTRDSALRCAAMLRERPTLGPVLACSDRFHQPRCVWLLRRAGIEAVAAPMPDERPAMRMNAWLYYRLREAAALAAERAAIILRRR